MASPTATNNFALGLIALGVLELATMLSVVIRVREGPKPKSREGRSWFSIAAEAWGTDILRERSFLWLVSSRLAILMAGSMLTQLATPYLRRSLGLEQTDTGLVIIGLTGLVALGTLIAVVPAARISDRIGRKPVIWASCVLGAVGLAICAAAPSVPFAYLGAGMYGLSAGIFLAVDWALMTDIIPKASSGRYMGLSNVATASSGVLAIAVGGSIIDFIGGGQGPRTTLWIAVGLMALGALLLRPVVRAPAGGLRGTGAGCRGQPGSGGLTLARTFARAASNQRRQVAGRRKSNGSGRRYSHGTNAHRKTR